MDNKDRLAGFHHTISEQLNARLEESPRFFWVLVAVSTGYGYVLWNLPPQNQQTSVLFLVSSVLAYLAVLWASWYLAALGYAFRYLQNSQHCMEHALGWDNLGPQGIPRESGKPPAAIKRCGDLFWMLPGIYHAHAFGLTGFLGIVVLAICWQIRQCHGVYWASFAGLALFGFGVGFIICINVHYVRMFRGKWRNPESVPLLS